MFGGFCPYWTSFKGKVLVADSAEEIIPVLPVAKRVIDPIAVAELLQFNYMLGNRTLVQGIFRMPWRATLNGKGEIFRKPPVPHGNNIFSPSEVAELLGESLEEELRQAILGRKSVHLLLTGGLDSRIVAGILKRIQRNTELQVSAVTWGDPQSRDVVYAKRICDWFNWKFVHVPFGVAETWKNIQEGARWGGSETSGIHLHGMSWFKGSSRDDLVIAASFGDSIGRAEFSSVHLTRLGLEPIRNPWQLMSQRFAQDWAAAAARDRETAWEGERRLEHCARCELDMQENYMRRMLVHITGFIGRYATLHQAFTSKRVVALMWSLAPECRTDQIYYELLKKLDCRLYDLPWARTGVSPAGIREPDSSLKTDYHQYGLWLRTVLAENMQPFVFSSGLETLQMFSPGRIQKLWDLWQKEEGNDLTLGETMAKLCSIEMSRQYYILQPYASPNGSYRGAPRGTVSALFRTMLQRT